MDNSHRARWEAIASDGAQQDRREPGDVPADLLLDRHVQQILAAELGEQLGQYPRPEPV
jgi:hypothetical protein